MKNLPELEIESIRNGELGIYLIWKLFVIVEGFGWDGGAWRSMLKGRAMLFPARSSSFGSIDIMTAPDFQGEVGVKWMDKSLW